MSVGLPSSYRPLIQVDWANDGTFSGPYDDVTADTAADPGLLIDTGRDGARSLNPPKVPAVDFELDNHDGKYSHESPNSPVYQLVRPGTPVLASISFGERRLYRADVGYRAHVIYRGLGQWVLARTRVDDVSQTTALGAQRVALQTLGQSSTLVGRAVTIPLQQSIRTDQAVNLILDAAGWPAAKRDIALGDTTLLYWWADERSAWDALIELLASEGPGTMYEDADGVLHWEGRNYRAVTPRSQIPQAAFFDGITGEGAGYLFFTQLGYSPGWKYLYSRATYPTRRRELGALGTVWEYGADLALGPNQQRTLFARPTDPFQNAVAPAAGTDYALSSGTATVALTYTSGLLAIITVTAGGAGCLITGPPSDPTTGLRLRAQPLTVASETIAESSIAPTDSAAAYGGIQTLDVAGWPEVGVATAEAVCNAWVTRYRSQRPQVTINVRAADAQHFYQIVTREVSDRITVREANTGLTADAWIESRRIVLAGAGGRYLEAVWQCEKAETLVGERWNTAIWNEAVWGT